MIYKFLFFLWFGLIVFFSVVPNSAGDQSFLSRMSLTRSGFFLHVFGYFVLTALAFFAFEKREDRGRKSEVGGRRSEGRNQRSEDNNTGMLECWDKECRGQRAEVRGRRKEVFFICLSGFGIFVCSLILEGVQYALPYRTFNWYDVVANGIGVLVFGVLMLFIGHRRTQTDTDFCPADSAGQK